MPISRRLRFEILRRDNYTCRYCGASPTSSSDVVLEVDHVIPTTLGGNDDPRNLTVACADCNAGKSSVPADAPLVDDVDATAMLFAKAVERAAEIHRAQRQADKDADDTLTSSFRAHWNPYKDVGDDVIPLPDGWQRTVIGYANAGLNHDDLVANIAIAMRSRASHADVFRYFCGVCRKVIAQRHELARRLIEDGDV